jgi:hypothetical protein
MPQPAFLIKPLFPLQTAGVPKRPRSAHIYLLTLCFFPPSDYSYPTHNSLITHYHHSRKKTNLRHPSSTFDMPPLWFLKAMDDRKTGRDKRGPSRHKEALSDIIQPPIRPSSSSTADQTTRVGSTQSASRPATATSATQNPTMVRTHKKVDSGTTFVADGKSRDCNRERTFSGILDGGGEERHDGEQEKESGGLRKKTWKTVKGAFGKKNDGEKR